MRAPPGPRAPRQRTSPGPRVRISAGAQLAGAGALGAAARPSQSVWHVVVDGEQVGPLTEAEIKDRLRQGKINSDTLVWKEGFGDWTAVLGGARADAVARQDHAPPGPAGRRASPSRPSGREPRSLRRPRRPPARCGRRADDPFAAPTVVSPAGTADLFASAMAAPAAPAVAPVASRRPALAVLVRRRARAARRAGRGSVPRAAMAPAPPTSPASATRTRCCSRWPTSEALAVPAQSARHPRAVLLREHRGLGPHRHPFDGRHDVERRRPAKAAARPRPCRPFRRRSSRPWRRCSCPCPRAVRPSGCTRCSACSASASWWSAISIYKVATAPPPGCRRRRRRPRRSWLPLPLRAGRRACGRAGRGSDQARGGQAGRGHGGGEASRQVQDGRGQGRQGRRKPGEPGSGGKGSEKKGSRRAGPQRVHREKAPRGRVARRARAAGPSTICSARSAPRRAAVARATRHLSRPPI